MRSMSPLTAQRRIEFVLTADCDLILLNLMSPGNGEDALMFRLRRMLSQTQLILLLATETLRTIVMLDTVGLRLSHQPFTNTKLAIRCHQGVEAC